MLDLIQHYTNIKLINIYIYICYTLVHRPRHEERQVRDSGQEDLYIYIYIYIYIHIYIYIYICSVRL